VKKSNSSRQGAKMQRHAKKNCLVFFAPSAPLRLCVKCFCSSKDYFTASDRRDVRATRGRVDRGTLAVLSLQAWPA